MGMTAHEIATKAARMARRGYDDVSILDTPPHKADIIVADEDGIRGLSVCAAISGFPILTDRHRQVTLPEAEAVRALTAWIAGVELLADADEEVATCTEIEAQRVFDAIFQAAADATAPGAAADDWPFGSGDDREWTLAGPWGARLTFTARTDETGRLTGISWNGRGADGASVHNHGGVEAATAVARQWAAGLDELPALTPAGLRARRQALGLSQAELANILGVSQAAYAQWETGTRAPRNPAQVSATLADTEDQVNDLAQQLARAAKTHADHDSTRVATLTTLVNSSPVNSSGLSPALHRTATGHAYAQLRRAGYHPIIEGTR